VAAVTKEQIYDAMLEIRDRLDRAKDRMAGLHQEIVSIDLRMAAMRIDIANLYAVLGRNDLRLERIERRLDLVEVP
jgi:hypothetical protein